MYPILFISPVFLPFKVFTYKMILYAILSNLESPYNVMHIDELKLIRKRNAKLQKIQLKEPHNAIIGLSSIVFKSTCTMH